MSQPTRITSVADIANLPEMAPFTVIVNPLPGTVARAEAVLTESEALVSGLFLADPMAPAVFGRMQATIAELVRTLRAVTA